MKSELEKLVGRYRELGIDRQLDYDKFLYKCKPIKINGNPTIFTDKCYSN